MSRLLLQCSQLHQSFGSLTLFEDLSLSINEKEVFALIGENGAGKTTLLKLLIGDLLPDSGILKRSPHLTIGFLPQEISLIKSSITARDYLEEGSLAELENQMADCLEDPQRLPEWERLHEKYEHLGGYRRLPVEKVLKGLKLDLSLLDLPMDTLSSGQKIRIALAKALCDNPDLLLLDEPTNHLDQEMVCWLKETLHLREGATVIVSHDRKFLNDTCNRLINIKKRKLFYYGGNYDFYLDEQKKILEKEMKAYEEQKEEKAFLKQKIKAITFSKGKATPVKDRNIMAYDRRGENHQKSQQRNLDVMKARLEEIESHPLPHPKPKTIKGLRFYFAPLASSVAIEINQATKAFGGKVLFSNLNKSLRKGDRIILTGANGSGKTTLLRCLVGDFALDQGSIRYAPTAKVGYLDQEIQRLPMEKTPLQYFEERFHLTEEELRSEMHKAALGGEEMLGRSFLTLSVGQRKRLMLLSLILEKPNVLLLDEPTNHLDLMTLEALETALLHFDGALLAVSHDAIFIEKIGTEEWFLG